MSGEAKPRFLGRRPGPDSVARGARAFALYRNATYSPNQHRTNDTAILDAVVERLQAVGWTITRASETDLVTGAVTPETLADTDLILNMCQGPDASERLLPIEATGVPMINRPSSVLGCHRHRLVTHMAGRPIAFPRTAVVPTAGAPELDGFGADGRLVWVKRGDVHAERTEDVVAVSRAELRGAIHAFAKRGITRVALQEHVPGPVLKFYGVASGAFFRCYAAEQGPTGALPAVDTDRLRALAFSAAAALGLAVFGGDVALAAPDMPVLIDLNDWPSFAPFREEAAHYIAAYAEQYAPNFSRDT